MSLEKVERFLTPPEEEGQPRRQRLPFTVAREDSPCLFQASTNFFNGPVGTHREELFGFSGQIHQYQQPSDHFSFEESKCLSIGLKDQPFCDSHGFPAGRRSPSAPIIKWTSSKMRVMRKMMAEQQQQQRISATRGKPRRRMQRPPHCQPLPSREINAEIRVCSGCSTTKTPLWRGGPQGPKTLCNACGIRQMKARRAVVAASSAPPQGNAVLRNGGMSERYTLAITARGEKKYLVPYKKRHKFAADPLQESSPSSAFHPAFPQDEKDAAILLMALSCG